MNKRVFALVITLVFIICIGGCREKETPAGDNSSNPVSAESDMPASPETVAIKSETPSSPAAAGQDNAASDRVHIDLATDELLDKYPSFHEYVNDEDGAYVMLWTDVTVKDFAFITVNLKESGNLIFFSAGEILASVDELSPEKPFVVKLLIPGSIPAYGISYVDESGAKRYYTINMDGRGIDEAPPYLLIEFDNGK